MGRDTHGLGQIHHVGFDRSDVDQVPGSSQLLPSQIKCINLFPARVPHPQPPLKVQNLDLVWCGAVVVVVEIH